MFRTDSRRAEALDRAWDELGRDGLTTLDQMRALDPALQEALLRLHQRDDLPPPDPAFLRSLREELMHVHPGSSTEAVAAPRQLGRVDSAQSAPWRLNRLSLGGEHRSLPRRVIDFAALAALLALVVGGTLVGQGLLPGRGPGLPGSVSGVPIATPIAENITQRDEGNSAVAVEPPEDRAVPRWTIPVFNELGFYAGSPVIADGLIIASGLELDDDVRAPIPEESAMIALDATAATVRWRVSASEVAAANKGDGVLFGAPVVGNGVVYATFSPHPMFDDPTPVPGALDGSTATLLSGLAALDAATGATRWKVALSVSSEDTPMFDGISVYVRGRGRTFFAVDAATGAERWRTTFDRGSETLRLGSVDHVAVRAGIFYISSGGRWLTALDADDRQVLWRFEWPGTASGVAFEPRFVVSDGLVYLSANLSGDATRPTTGRIIALDAASGAVRWDRVYPGWTSGLTGGGGLLIASNGSGIVALEAMNGTERWRVKTDGHGDDRGTPVVRGGTIYIWVEYPGLFESYLSILGGKSTLLAVDLASGQERWRLNGEPTDGWSNFVVGIDMAVVIRFDWQRETGTLTVYDLP